MNDQAHLSAIARLCQELSEEVDLLRPEASDDTWPRYLEAVSSIAAIWHHLEQINSAGEEERDPYF